MPQVHEFDHGRKGWCIHKLRGDWKGNVSAWFDENKALTAACQKHDKMLPHFSGRHVPLDSPMARRIAKTARVYLPL